METTPAEVRIVDDDVSLLIANRLVPLRQATVFNPCHSLIDSQWGKIRYDDWCEREGQRIAQRQGKHYKVHAKRIYGANCCALFMVDLND